MPAPRVPVGDILAGRQIPDCRRHVTIAKIAVYPVALPLIRPRLDLELEPAAIC